MAKKIKLYEVKAKYSKKLVDLYEVAGNVAEAEAKVDKAVTRLARALEELKRAEVGVEVVEVAMAEIWEAVAEVDKAEDIVMRMIKDLLMLAKYVDVANDEVTIDGDYVEVYTKVMNIREIIRCVNALKNGSIPLADTNSEQVKGIALSSILRCSGKDSHGLGIVFAGYAVDGGKEKTVMEIIADKIVLAVHLRMIDGKEAYVTFKMEGENIIPYKAVEYLDNGTAHKAWRWDRASKKNPLEFTDARRYGTLTKLMNGKDIPFNEILLQFHYKAYNIHLVDEGLEYNHNLRVCDMEKYNIPDRLGLTYGSFCCGETNRCHNNICNHIRDSIKTYLVDLPAGGDDAEVGSVRGDVNGVKVNVAGGLKGVEKSIFAYGKLKSKGLSAKGYNTKLTLAMLGSYTKEEINGMTILKEKIKDITILKMR